MDLVHIQQALNLREIEALSPLAASSAHAIRRRPEPRIESEYRQAYSIDVDRIIASMAFTRYIDKTQVFSLIRHDHLSHRVLHVQLVSKIGRTMGRFLGLNEDLIEAIALGHDIGHTPFGHDGERYLAKLCRANGIGSFEHNAQSIQFLDRVEKKGQGLNLTLDTMNGIFAHDGDIFSGPLKPVRGQTFDALDMEYRNFIKNPGIELYPSTMEGCLVRFADMFGYIGRDIEDAIRLGLIERDELPAEATRILGNSNGTIVYTLVTDVIRHSFQQPHVTLGDDAAKALKRLKKFNLERIYLNHEIKKHLGTVEASFDYLFAQYMDDIKTRNNHSAIYKHYLCGMDDCYMETHSPAEIVRDFIAGMTDQYFLEQCPDHLKPSLLYMRRV